MKRIFVVALATFTLSSLTVLHAQQATAPAAQPAAAAKHAKGDPAEKRAEQLKTQLNLSDAQTSQVKDLLTQEHADMLKIKQDASLDDKAKREQARALNKQYQEKVNALLTPDQQKAYAAMEKPRGKKKSEK